jgi:hypothetical protein
VAVGWCNVEFPPSIPDQAEGMPLPRAGTTLTWPGFPAAIYARVYAPGVTTAPGNQALIQGDIGFGPVGSDPSDPAQANSWSWQALTFNSTNCSNCGSNYEYEINPLVPSTPGVYNYAARFSGDGRRSFQYCAGNAGTSAGSPYVTNQAPVINVAGSSCQPDTYACGVDSDCCSGGCGNSQCCPSGQTDCSGECVDLQTNNGHCGTCPNTCPNTAIECTGGHCVCEPLTTNCLQGSDCCSGNCQSNQCTCSGVRGGCASQADCCFPDSACTNGSCACITAGNSCLQSADCCSENCSAAGYCDCGIYLAPCSQDSDCCQGSCSNHVCTGCSSPGMTCSAPPLANDCCTGSCEFGSCNCGQMGSTCTQNSDCCTGFGCANGTCS